MSQSKRSSKDKYLDCLKTRYAHAPKKERGKILDEYVQTTGYHRKHAIAILSGQYQPVKRPIHRPRKAVYTAEDAKALAFLSDLFDGINAKLFRAALDVELKPLYQRGVLKSAGRVIGGCNTLARRVSIGCGPGMGHPVPNRGIGPSPARCSRARFPFVPGRTGTKTVLALSKWTWSAMMAAICMATTA